MNAPVNVPSGPQLDETSSSGAPYLQMDGAYVVENAATGTFVSHLTGYGMEGDASFSLVYDAGGRFKIENGCLVVADGARIDFETAPSYDLMIRVANEQNLFRDVLVTVYVNDDPAVPDLPPPPPPIVNHAPVVVNLTSDWATEISNPG